MCRGPRPKASSLAAGGGYDLPNAMVSVVRHPSLDPLGTGGRGSAAGPTSHD